MMCQHPSSVSVLLRSQILYREINSESQGSWIYKVLIIVYYASVMTTSLFLVSRLVFLVLEIKIWKWQISGGMLSSMWNWLVEYVMTFSSVLMFDNNPWFVHFWQSGNSSIRALRVFSSMSLAMCWAFRATHACHYHIWFYRWLFHVA